MHGALAALTTTLLAHSPKCNAKPTHIALWEFESDYFYSRSQVLWHLTIDTRNAFSRDWTTITTAEQRCGRHLIVKPHRFAAPSTRPTVRALAGWQLVDGTLRWKRGYTRSAYPSAKTLSCGDVCTTGGEAMPMPSRCWLVCMVVKAYKEYFYRSNWGHVGLLPGQWFYFVLLQVGLT